MKPTLPLLDLSDSVVRAERRLAHLPRYSLRVRSTSMAGEFGGRRWLASGAQLRQSLIEHADLRATDQVLEIGCGAGRIALALSEYLTHGGGYTGFDVDGDAVAACEQTLHLYLAGFSFFVADVANELYRPDGATPASKYRFPLADGIFDFVLLANVFPYMLEADRAHYATEILRVLRPGGTVALSARLRRHDPPELDTFQQWFPAAGVQPLLGRWRRDGTEQTEEWDDWIVVRAPEEARPS